MGKFVRCYEASGSCNRCDGAKVTEHETQSAIIKLIRKSGGVATRVNSGNVSRHVKGADKGTSDIIALYKGVYLAIEVKDGDRKATQAQLDFGELVELAGGLFIVARDVETIEAIMDEIDNARSISFREKYGKRG